MAAGLGFKTFATGDVLSAGDTNGYLMQGVLVFADATARTAAITSPQEGQTSYLKDTDVIQVYSGSAWVTKSGGASPLTTKGDLYGYSTVDARIAVGTNGQVLTADSTAATGVAWASAGGMTLINTGGTTLSGASVNIASIPATYNALKIIIVNYKPATDNAYLAMQFNGDSTVNRHWYQGSFTAAPNKPYDSTFGAISYGQDNTASSTSIIEINVPYYANTSIWKMYESYSVENNATTTTNLNMMVNMGGYNQTTAISSLTFLTNGGNLTSGTVYIYGVK